MTPALLLLSILPLIIVETARGRAAALFSTSSGVSALQALYLGTTTTEIFAAGGHWYVVQNVWGLWVSAAASAGIALVLIRCPTPIIRPHLPFWCVYLGILGALNALIILALLRPPRRYLDFERYFLEIRIVYAISIALALCGLVWLIALMIRARRQTS